MSEDPLEALMRMFDSGRPLEITEWEEEFLESVLERHEEYVELSEKQQAVVDRILEKNREHPRRWL